MIKLAVLLSALVACGDNIAPPDAANVTWRDAMAAWFDVLCSGNERCFPDDFHQNNADHDGCVAFAVEYNCGASSWCDATYPADKLDELELCRFEMAELPCDANVAPESCYLAFE